MMNHRYPHYYDEVEAESSSSIYSTTTPRSLLVVERILFNLNIVGKGIDDSTDNENNNNNNNDECWEELLFQTSTTTITKNGDESPSLATIMTCYGVCFIAFVAAGILFYQSWKHSMECQRRSTTRTTTPTTSKSQSTSRIHPTTTYKDDYEEEDNGDGNNEVSPRGSSSSKPSSYQTAVGEDEEGVDIDISNKRKEEVEEEEDEFIDNNNSIFRSKEKIQTPTTTTLTTPTPTTSSPKILSTLKDLESYDDEDPLLRNLLLEYYCSIRRRALSWYLCLIGISYLLNALRYQFQSTSSSSTTTDDFLTASSTIGNSHEATNEEWFIRGSYTALMLSFPGIIIGVLSNRIVAGIDEQYDQIQHKQKITVESFRIQRQAWHGSIIGFTLLVFVAAAVLTLLLPIEDATWFYGVVLLIWTCLVSILTCMTSGCIGSDGFVLGENDTPPPKTSLTAISSFLFAISQVLVVAAFLLHALLTPICNHTNNDNSTIGSIGNETHTTTTTNNIFSDPFTVGDVFVPETKKEDNLLLQEEDDGGYINCDFSSSSCPLSDNFPPLAMAHLLNVLSIIMILGGGLLLPKP